MLLKQLGLQNLGYGSTIIASILIGSIIVYHSLIPNNKIFDLNMFLAIGVFVVF